MDNYIPVNEGESTGKKLALEAVLRKAKASLTELTGFAASAVVEAGTGDEDNWVLKVEMVEREAIPSTLDLIGLYEVVLDQRGKILGYARKNMRKRGESYSEA